VSCVSALIKLPLVIHAIIFGLFLATFCYHFLASFGEQFGYKIFLHLATLNSELARRLVPIERRSDIAVESLYRVRHKTPQFTVNSLYGGPE